ncbi:DUF1471 domain-containing protein [Escherichia coli]|nr:DUF1471 domain-containing protein [Escherichia coli]
MFSRVLALLAVLLLSANTWAAIEINNHQARNMDDVQGATYYHVILMREPGSNGNMHASADIYR